MNAKAFLMFSVEMEDLPEPYKTVVGLHLELEPQIFALPWPIEAFPTVGCEIVLRNGAGPFEEMVVEKHKQILNGTELRMEAWCGPENGDLSVRNYKCILESLAELGCLIFPSREPVEKILREAGLLSGD